MNIKKLIKENYEIAKSKGFYPDDSKIEDHLMGIVSELGKAYEAHRGGKFYDTEFGAGFLYAFINGEVKKTIGITLYKDMVSGTFEDELADVFIRLFNLCGWLGIYDIKLSKIKECRGYTQMSQHLLAINGLLSEMQIDPEDTKESYIETILSILLFYCGILNIPIEKHILAKMSYNKTREHLHGKKY